MKVYRGSAFNMGEVADGSQHACITSAPYYGLRCHLPVDHPDRAYEIGAERTSEEYAEKIRAVGREVWRCLRDDGTWWLRVGARLQGGGLESVPHEVWQALKADGWLCFERISWCKAMPSGVTSTRTPVHEEVILLAKGTDYAFDPQARNIWEFWRNRLEWSGADVRPWTRTAPYQSVQEAVLPPSLIAPMIRFSTSEAGCCRVCGAQWRRVTERRGRRMRRAAALEGVPGGFVQACACQPQDPVPCSVLDPWGGSGATAGVAEALGRATVLYELYPDSIAVVGERVRRIAKRRSVWDSSPKTAAGLQMWFG